MSDTSSGPGGWNPSDGRWYPPDLPPGDQGGVEPPWATQWEAGWAGPGPEAPRRRHRPVVVLLTAVVVLAMIGGVLAGTIGSGQDDDAAAAVVDAVATSLAHKTALVHTTSTLRGGGQTIVTTASGSVDLAHDAVELHEHLGSGGPTVDEVAVSIRDRVYIELPGITQRFPGKRWVSADLSALRRSGVSGVMATGDPADALRALARDGDTVTALGPSTVHGATVQGYAVHVDLAALQHQVGAASLPDWARQEMSRVAAEHVSESVYVDGAGELSRLTMELDGRTVHTTTTTDFTDYGTPVSISAPPAGQVVPFEQFLRTQAQSQTG